MCYSIMESEGKGSWLGYLPLPKVLSDIQDWYVWEKIGEGDMI